MDAEQIIGTGIFDRSEDRIRELVPEPISVIEFLKLEGIDSVDKIDAVITGCFIPAEAMARFAVDCAKRSLILEHKSGREPDDRLWRSVRIGEWFLLGKSNSNDVVSARNSADRAVKDANQSAKKATKRVCSEATHIARLSRSGDLYEANRSIRKTQKSIKEAAKADAERNSANSVFHAIAAVSRIHNAKICSANAKLAASFAAFRASASARAEQPIKKHSGTSAWREEVNRQCDHIIDLVEKENNGGK